MLDRRIARRDFLKGTIAAGATVSLGGFLAACSSPASTAGAGASAAAGGKDLIVRFDAGSFRDYLDAAVTKPFIAKYGATVTYDSATEPDGLAKAIAAKGHRIDDVQELDSKDIAKAISAGVADTLDKSVVTNWADIDPHFRNDSWASIITYYFGIVYNKDKIPEGMTSWFDLWNPKYQGKVGFPSFDWEGFQWLLIINHVLGGTEAEFSKGIAKIAAYYKGQKPVTVTGSDNGVQLFTSGDVWASPFFDGRARQLEKAGVNVAYVFPKEGAAALGEGLGLMANANKLLAEQYINFALDPANQIAFARQSNYSPTNLKALASLPSDMQNLIVPQDALNNLLKIDDATGYDHIADAQKAWNEQVLG